MKVHTVTVKVTAQDTFDEVEVLDLLERLIDVGMADAERSIDMEDMEAGAAFAATTLDIEVVRPVIKKKSESASLP